MTKSRRGVYRTTSRQRLKAVFSPCPEALDRPRTPAERAVNKLSSQRQKLALP
jgi:hypothetical protein